ncbi:iron complex outermembrane receptor protein [Thermoflavifilum aggregans]|uniref:Iron complex outermembrane receptor protein n=1 Tax=Thermoflavifilum aggregans TaxID=454188 RepID=A0A2M9CRF0_9BACT|nr:TonB-dependent receptor [Thermoflavifilum aggregans]PJJ74493.1 iron complex outermembrane receptor protein [Thermoflavifilum aggregans]
MRNSFAAILLLPLLYAGGSSARNICKIASDSLPPVLLNEVVITSSRQPTQQAEKPLSTMDEYLQQMPSVHMIRRGAYAWLPYLDGLPDDRAVITIDGMRIYGACTDKMDPVTSYVEIMNLQKADIHNGQSRYGPVSSGSLNMVLSNPDFGEPQFKGSVFSGYETNNHHRMIGMGATWIDPRSYLNIDMTYRHAGDYHAGGGEIISPSQFTKYNVSASGGYQIDAQRQVRFNWIYDRATDLGYPALPMDVSLARAQIFSVNYRQQHPWPGIYLWTTRIYFNEVKHVMDNAHRSGISMYMDMPGWTQTAGWISGIEKTVAHHHWLLQLNGHWNRSVAEMTMYPANNPQRTMFMLTWPGVHIEEIDGYIQDSLTGHAGWQYVYSAGLTLHNNEVYDQRGISELKMFYPNESLNKLRWLKRSHFGIFRRGNTWTASLQVGYGERPPTVSEAYGLYLYNSMDNYDYIGNPNLKNEQSVNLQVQLHYYREKISVAWQTGVFYMLNYIIGLVDSTLKPMTMGAAGVRVYQQLPEAIEWNSTATLQVQVAEAWLWNAQLGMSVGSGKNLGYLPFQRPLSFSTGISWSQRGYQVHAGLEGANHSWFYNADYGEKPVSGYAIVNISAGKTFQLGKKPLTLKIGMENILDKNYTTYADWNRVPRMGRNAFVNIVYGW